MNEEEVSKSQKKREADALQKIGVAISEWNTARINSLPLPENLHKAIIEAKAIKSHGAKRRQAQLIGKLMRAAPDIDDIIAAYESVLADDSAVTANFHEVELWRDKLIHNKDALTEFINLHHPEDVQHLRQLIKKALEDELKEKNTGAAKALFRHLRSIIT